MLSNIMAGITCRLRAIPTLEKMVVWPPFFPEGNISTIGWISVTFLHMFKILLNSPKQFYSYIQTFARYIFQDSEFFFNKTIRLTLN